MESPRSQLPGTRLTIRRLFTPTAANGAAQKSKFPKLIVFDIVITSNDHPNYVKHVLGRIYVFFPVFGY